MKKRIFAFFLALVMVVGLMPTALAVETDYSSEDAITRAKTTCGQTDNDNFWYVGKDKTIDSVYAYLTSADSGTTYTLHIVGNGRTMNFSSSGYWLSNASSISVIDVGEGITYLGSNLTRNTINVTINLPATLTGVNTGTSGTAGASQSTFGNNSTGGDDFGIEAIVVAAGNTAFKVENGVLFSYDGTILYRYTNEAEENYVLPNTVTTLAAKAFSRNTHLKSVNLNNGTLTTICPDQFDNVKNSDFTVLVIPKTVTTMNGATVSNCSSLTRIEILCSSFTGSTVSKGNFGLATVVLSDDCTVIPDDAFNDISSITSVNLPAKLQSIGKNAFNRTKLLTVRFPGSVTPIGEYAFQNITTLTVVDMTALSDSIVFDGTALFGYNTSIVTDESLRITKIGYVASDEVLTKLETANASYMVYAHTNGGTFETTPTSNTELATPKKDGYTFAGWFKEDGTEAAYTPEDATTVAEKTYTATAGQTYYAKWEVDPNYNPDTPEAPALEDRGRSLSLKDVIYINQYAGIDIAGYDRTYIEQNGGLLVWTSDPGTNATIDSANVQKIAGLTYAGTYDGDKNEYWAATDGIFAKEYADECYLSIYLELEDGSYIYTPVKEYSVQIYCENKINGTGTKETLKNLCRDMLNYGASAQLYFEYKTDDLANKNISN